MSLLENVLLRDDRASQPAATAVAEGSLYYVTDESITEQSRGGVWVSYSDASTIANDSVTFAKIQNIATDRLLGRDTAASGDVEELTVTGGLEFSGSGGIRRSALTGDVTAAAGNNATTIANNAVTLAKIAQASGGDILLGRISGVGNYEEIGLGANLSIVAGDLVAAGGGGGAADKTRTIGITIDGGGAPFTTGIKGYKSFPIAGTITGCRLLADISGSVVIDIWKDTYANYPPTVADTITAAAKPTLSGAIKNEDVTLTGWTTTVNAGDVFGFNVDSIATLTRVVLELTILLP